MGIKKHIRKIQVNYVKNKIKETHIPSFKPAPLVRKKIMFLGKVQKVGFRLEIYELAKRLNLVGHVENKKDNKVQLEIQGEEEKILFLVGNMKSLKRAKVVKVEMIKIPVVKDEKEFIIIK